MKPQTKMYNTLDVSFPSLFIALIDKNLKSRNKLLIRNLMGILIILKLSYIQM